MPPFISLVAGVGFEPTRIGSGIIVSQNKGPVNPLLMIV